MKKVTSAPSKILTRLLLVVAVAFVTAISGHSAPGSAAPGSPGVPEAPVVIYNEDFENNHSTSPIPLTSYTGSEGMTYTANAAWRTNCNGEVIFFDMADNEFANTNCDGGNGTNATTAYDAVRRLSYALGTLHGGNSQTAPANRALTAYTDNGATYVSPGADLVQFETLGSVSFNNGIRRFVISNIDVAAINCTNSGTVQGKLRLYLLDGGTPRQINQSVINICTASTATSVTPPSLESNGAIAANTGSIMVGSVFTDQAILANSNSLGIRMINEEGVGQGNDNAIDNVQMIDASPKLDKQFDPQSTVVGGTSRMTFTVTNTTDLLEKPGWSFTDTLPENLKVASEPNSATTCPNGEITATAGGSVVEYQGDLAADMQSCTLSIDVTSNVAGTYVNGPSNLSEVIGLHLPADAEVTFTQATPGVPNSGSQKQSLLKAMVLGVALFAGVGAWVARKRFSKNMR